MLSAFGSGTSSTNGLQAREQRCTSPRRCTDGAAENQERGARDMRIRGLRLQLGVLELFGWQR